MIFVIIFYVILSCMYIFSILTIVKKDDVPFFNKIAENTAFNVIGVGSTVVIIWFVIPFVPQNFLRGDFMLILNIVGVVLIILGCLNFIWLFQLKRGVGGQEMDKLLTSGAYGFSRHPIYLGHLMVFYGILLISGGFDALILSPILILLEIMAAKTEEKYSIGKTFKEEYEVYKKKVPMFLKWWIFLIISIGFISFLLISLNLGYLTIQV